MKKNIIKGLTLAALVLAPTMSMAEVFWKTTSVNRILIETGRYGGCMMQLPLNNDNCKTSWVSFDCDGKYSDAGQGDRMLNVALIAQTMGKSVSILIDTTKKHNGYCVVKRIDIFK